MLEIRFFEQAIQEIIKMCGTQTKRKSKSVKEDAIKYYKRLNVCGSACDGCE